MMRIIRPLLLLVVLTTLGACASGFSQVAATQCPGGELSIEGEAKGEISRYKEEARLESSYECDHHDLYMKGERKQSVSDSPSALRHSDRERLTVVKVCGDGCLLTFKGWRNTHSINRRHRRR